MKFPQQHKRAVPAQHRTIASHCAPCQFDLSVIIG